ncbi:hypothetical protein PoB_001197500 [Plakobranchus ocellatus]|uniref:DDE-1 domain-containing protein n=1 Tax=Plakobranchus ocellatus TaxID=259542 RepID=A0AAV3YRT2_9GAST|nr:hypothetical protein PoB_001197500 [Plakobranchus ocellatus]
MEVTRRELGSKPSTRMVFFTNCPALVQALAGTGTSQMVFSFTTECRYVGEINQFGMCCLISEKWLMDVLQDPYPIPEQNFVGDGQGFHTSKQVVQVMHTMHKAAIQCLVSSNKCPSTKQKKKASLTMCMAISN